MTDAFTPIAVAVVQHNDRFLVGRRPAGGPLAGLWEFPGGKVRAGEAPADAARRECREETGLDVLIVGTYPPQEQRYEHDAVRLHFFACRPLADQPPPRAPFRWAARSELAQLEFPSGNRRLLTQLLGNEPPPAP